MREGRNEEDYRAGQWDAFNRILNLINSSVDRERDIKHFYAKVMDMRPEAPDPEILPALGMKGSFFFGVLSGVLLDQFLFPILRSWI